MVLLFTEGEPNQPEHCQMVISFRKEQLDAGVYISASEVQTNECQGFCDNNLDKCCVATDLAYKYERFLPEDTQSGLPARNEWVSSSKSESKSKLTVSKQP